MITALLFSIDEHLSLPEMSIKTRFPGLGVEKKNVKRMDYSVMVPMSSSESG